MPFAVFAARLFYTGGLNMEPSTMFSRCFRHTQRLPSPACAALPGAAGVLHRRHSLGRWCALPRGSRLRQPLAACNGTILQHSASVSTMIELPTASPAASSFFASWLLAWTFAGTVRGHLARAQLWHRFSSR